MSSKNSVFTYEEMQAAFQKISAAHLEFLEEQKIIQASQKKTDEMQKKTDEKLDKVAKMIGGHVNNAGDIAEEFFYRGLKQRKHLGTIRFDVVRRNAGSIKEYDIILVNGNAVAVVSVKTKLHKNDIERFVKKDLPDFKKEFPEFNKYRLYGGVAGMSVKEDVEAFAKKQGLYVLTQSGDHPKLLNDADFEGTVF